MKLFSSQKGISLIEIVIIIAVVGLIIAITAPALGKFRKSQSIQNTTNTVVSILQEARSKTLASYNNTFYSVYFGANSATLFSGGTYSAVDPNNKVVSYGSPVVLQSVTLVGGGSSVSFDRLKGTTSQSGTIVVGIPSGESKTVTVSASGAISRN